MAEGLVRSHAIANALLELFRFGKALLRFPVPDHVFADANLECAAGLARHKRHLAELLLEGDEQLLREPSGAQEPPALRTIFDLDARRVNHGRTWPSPTTTIFSAVSSFTDIGP